MSKTLKYWGWGYEGDGLDANETKTLMATFAEGYGIQPTDDGMFPSLDAITLAAPRLTPPGSLAKFCTSDTYERVLHTFGHPDND